MHRIRIALGTIVCVGLLGMMGCNKQEPAPAPKPAPPVDKPTASAAPVEAAPQLNRAMLVMFKPALPAAIESPKNPLTPQKIDLGRQLYYDTRFSLDQSISCNTCHDLKHYGIDPRAKNATSEGHNGAFGGRNSPTVYNAAGHIAQFWDGRAADVEEQAKGPVLNPVEMAMPDPQYVVKVLKSIPGYVEAFKAAFPDDADPINYDNFGQAIGAFERKLVTPGRFDKFLAGDTTALTADEQSGLAEFMSVGCTTCHMGTYLGGQMYQKVGLLTPWPNQKDQGRFDLTQNEADKMMFKVPALRDCAKTGPYFHDGSVDDIHEAVRMMAKYQLGKDLTDEQVHRIVVFLESLTGDIPADYIVKPELPASGPNTPGPQKT